MHDFAVQKFGGSSMACPETAAAIFGQDKDRNRVAIVSAIGKKPGVSGAVKVTDMLIRLEKAVDKNNPKTAAEVREQVAETTRLTFSTLGRKVLAKITDETNKLLRSENRDEGFAWVGEHISARLFAELTGALYVPTELKFSGGILNIDYSLRAITESLAQALKSGRQVVSGGYYGHDRITGRVVTLPRGGTDITSVVYAGALDQQDRGMWIDEIYTDKDGILSADPDIVPGAIVIPKITHNETREKMHGVIERNGVVHGDAIAYAARLGVEVLVKNTFNPDAPGTHIAVSRESSSERPVIGISGKRGINAVSVFDLGMAEAESYLSAILVRAGELSMSVANVPTAEDRIKLIFNHGDNAENLELLRQFITERTISGERAKVEVITGQGAVHIVGQELTKPLTYTEILGRATMLLAASGLPIREVVSHQDSPSLALTVEGSQVSKIIRLLHEELIEEKYKTGKN